jgi:hypothetical protein
LVEGAVWVESGVRERERRSHIASRNELVDGALIFKVVFEFSREWNSGKCSGKLIIISVEFFN